MYFEKVHNLTDLGNTHPSVVYLPRCGYFSSEDRKLRRRYYHRNRLLQNVQLRSRNLNFEVNLSMHIILPFQNDDSAFEADYDDESGTPLAGLALPALQLRVRAAS